MPDTTIVVGRRPASRGRRLRELRHQPGLKERDNDCHHAAAGRSGHLRGDPPQAVVDQRGGLGDDDPRLRLAGGPRHRLQLRHLHRQRRDGGDRGLPAGPDLHRLHGDPGVPLPVRRHRRGRRLHHQRPLRRRRAPERRPVLRAVLPRRQADLLDRLHGPPGRPRRHRRRQLVPDRDRGLRRGAADPAGPDRPQGRGQPGAVGRGDRQLADALHGLQRLHRLPGRAQGRRRAAHRALRQLRLPTRSPR